MLATDPVAPAGIWKQRLGLNYIDFKRSFLKPVTGLSDTYPCGRSSSIACGAYLIRKNGKRFLGICENSECDPIEVAETDLPRLHFDAEKVCGALADALGIQRDVRSQGVGIWLIGEHTPNIHITLPVAVVLPDGQDDSDGFFRRVVSTMPRPGFIGYPSQLSPPAEIVSLAHSLKIRLFKLDLIARFSGGSISINNEWNVFAQSFSEESIDRRDFEPEGAKKYPTPFGAKWSDVHIRFQNGHEVFIRVDPEEKWTRYGYKDMGMADGKSGEPVRSWRFLEELSLHSGGPVNQVKQEIESGGFPERSAKELNAALTSFFGISGRPVPYIKRPPKGYQTKFFIYPEGAE